MTTWPHSHSTPVAAHIGARHPQNARAAAGGDATYQARMNEIQMKLLDELEGQIDNLRAQRTAANESTLRQPLPLTDARRKLAHLVRLPAICARATCQRAGLCRGEPSHCLTVISPYLPPHVIAELKLGPRKSRRGRAQAFITPR